MASDRDTLAEHLDAVSQRGHGQTFLAPFFRGVVDLVLAAGWRLPAREISDPAELDALPPFSVVLAYGVSHQAVPDETQPVVWIKPFGSYTSAELLTACRGKGVTVLYEPADEEDDCPHDSRSGADGRWRCDQCGADCGPDNYLTEEAGR
ncbi:hypothetical protein [Nocardia sp. NPDC058480]|uniref:hypothetical protein n=1 Tax=Nocardia sp. NPDC058480 TaxID=3346522 RepID=UPI00364AB8D0